jgi:hypothetical protein
MAALTEARQALGKPGIGNGREIRTPSLTRQNYSPVPGVRNKADSGVNLSKPRKGKESGVTKSGSQKSNSPSQLIDARIKELGDWRGEMLGRLRALVNEVDADVVEEWKWRGVPVWSPEGLICTGETYEAVVKMAFAKGAALPDPSRLFNSSLEGNVRRAIDFREGGKIAENALKALIRAAVSLNTAKTKKTKAKRQWG